MHTHRTTTTTNCTTDRTASGGNGVRRSRAVRAGIVAGLAGLALTGPLVASAAADTPPFPGDSPVIVLPEPTVPPVVGPGDIVLPDPTIPPVVGPGDITLPDPADPDPGPDGPDDKAPPVPDDDPDPGPGPFDGPDDLTTGTTVPPVDPEPEPEPQPEPQPEVASETEEAPARESAAEELAFTGGDGSLVPIGLGLAAAGSLALGGAALARRRRPAEA